MLQKVAEESRSMEYRNDAVIDNNLLQSDMIYVVIKVRPTHNLYARDYLTERGYEKKEVSPFFQF